MSDAQNLYSIIIDKCEHAYSLMLQLQFYLKLFVI